MSGRDKLDALLLLINTAAQEAIGEYEKTGHGIPSLDSTDAHPLDTVEDSLALRKAVRLLEGACEQLCTALAPPVHTIINRGQAYDWACLRVVTRAHVADALTDRPNGLHVNELSSMIKVEKGKLARILRLLATRHCFREVDTDVFANNRLSIVLHSSNNFADLVQMHTDEGSKAASVLYENLIDLSCASPYDPAGSPFMYSVKDEGIKGTFFDWMKLHPERHETFGRAMVGVGNVMGSLAVLQNFPWNDFSTVCDVGSGVGAFAIPLARTYPHIKITLQDLPETITQAKEIWAKAYPQAIQTGRVDFTPLNFFETSPTKGQDIYYVRNIIHNWPDNAAMAILCKLRQAMLPHSRLLIHDYVLQNLNRKPSQVETAHLGIEVAPEPMLPNFGAGNIRMYNQDITMLLMFNAKERTMDDSKQLGTAAGLRLEKVWDLAETSVLEFRIAEPSQTRYML